MVFANEVDRNQQLAEGLVKSLTGGDKFTARHLYQNAFEFTPTFKIWLAGNHQPRADNLDSALWRRIKVLPFTFSIPEAERDSSVKRILKNTEEVGSAILAWVVKGCLSWQERGLEEPECVQVATRSYREDMDPIGEFIRDFCEITLSDRDFTPSDQIFQAYQKWAERNGVRYPLGQKALTNQLVVTRHCQRDRGRPYGQLVRGLRGIKLTAAAEQLLLHDLDPDPEVEVSEIELAGF